MNILVLAEDQWHDQPIISRSYLPVGTMKSQKTSLLPLRNLRRRPVKLAGLIMKVGGLMQNVIRGQQVARSQSLGSLSHEHAIHDHIPAFGNLLNCELVFRGNARCQSVLLSLEDDCCASL